MTTKRTLLALAAGLTLAGGVAFAQAPAAPMRVRATIEKVDGSTLLLKDRAGKEITVVLAPGATVTAVAKTDIAAIKSGSYIGSAAVPQPDGSLKALEVTVFPPAMKGTGEGHFPWDLGSTSTMTNGTVGDLVVSSGRVMTVKYSNGGEKKILVPEDVPIVSLEPGDASMLKPGAHILVVPTKAADGTLSANRISVGANGIVPPM